MPRRHGKIEGTISVKQSKLVDCYVVQLRDLYRLPETIGQNRLRLEQMDMAFGSKLLQCLEANGTMVGAYVQKYVARVQQTIDRSGHFVIIGPTKPKNPPVKIIWISAYPNTTWSLSPERPLDTAEQPVD